MRAALWILKGERYIQEGQVSAESLERHMPDVWRVLATPDPVGLDSGHFQKVIRLPPLSHSYWYLDQINWLRLCLEQLPEKILWLDSDTYCCMPCGELFDLLECFDLVGTHAPMRRTANVHGQIPDCFPEMQIGVNGLKNTEILRFFVGFWYEMYSLNAHVYGDNDQASLREALWLQMKHNTIMTCFQFYIFPPEWNLRLVSPEGYFVRDRVRFLHGRPDNLMLFEALGRIEELAEQANRKCGMRIWRIE